MSLLGCRALFDRRLVPDCLHLFFQYLFHYREEKILRQVTLLSLNHCIPSEPQGLCRCYNHSPHHRR